MPSIRVSKSITINEPAADIYSKLNDFTHWTSWSPWLIMEPGAKVTVSDDHKYYHWVGNRIGEGEMSIISEKESEHIDYNLTFLKPWKSKAHVGFRLSPKGYSTEVTWTMDSSLPWFMFWMKSQMEGFIGMDYVRGLNLLKDYVEKGRVESKLHFPGESEFDGIQFIGIKTSCPIDQVGLSMEKDFGILEQFLNENKDISTGLVFSQYHDWDMKKMETTYTVGYSVEQIPADLTHGIITGEIPPTRIYKTRHTGPYIHLGNAWSTMMNMERSKVFKQNKKIDPFEIYINDPGSVDEQDLITDVCFSIK